MIDLHFHCLTVIDDGPPDLESAIALCRAAAADGIETIIATPHVVLDAWLTDGAEQRDLVIAELNARLEGTPALLAGAEVWYHDDLVEIVSQNQSPTLAGTRYMLFELPPTSIPAQLDRVVHELVIAGVVPVLAHPERNVTLMRQSAQLDRLLQLGVKMQLTAGSIAGDFGQLTKKMCNELFDRGMVHFVGSDAHSVENRPPRMSAARRTVEQEWGSEAALTLFEINPQKLLANEEGIESA